MTNDEQITMSIDSCDALCSPHIITVLYVAELQIDVLNQVCFSEVKLTKCYTVKANRMY